MGNLFSFQVYGPIFQIRTPCRVEFIQCELSTTYPLLQVLFAMVMSSWQVCNCYFFFQVKKTNRVFMLPSIVSSCPEICWNWVENERFPLYDSIADSHRLASWPREEIHQAWCTFPSRFVYPYKPCNGSGGFYGGPDLHGFDCLTYLACVLSMRPTHVFRSHTGALISPLTMKGSVCVYQYAYALILVAFAHEGGILIQLRFPSCEYRSWIGLRTNHIRWAHRRYVDGWSIFSVVRGWVRLVLSSDWQAV